MQQIQNTNGLTNANENAAKETKGSS